MEHDPSMLRDNWRSGMEMFLIGSGAAIVTDLLGSLVGMPLAG